jgi:methylenetetrahydrofolate dehydrogenase (NADP+)/methenyltetrahydrofolate cyclohydrolase
MNARVIDGTSIARELRQTLASRAATLAARGRPPGLAVLLVGDDPASQVYVRNKVRACQDGGIHSVLEKHPAETAEALLLERIAALNADPAIDGILVQLPLPRHINAQRIIEAIDPSKDVDGLQVHSAGALLTASAGFRPCTPLGIMHLIDHTGTALRGANAVVIGRSNSVGKPVALLLLQRDATVTMCHSATRDLAGHVQSADVVIAAVGRRELIRGDMIKPGAVVIDVGINRDENGKLWGDVEFAGASERASWITPVPGGVGPMTIAMLLANTVESAERSLADKR